MSKTHKDTSMPHKAFNDIIRSHPYDKQRDYQTLANKLSQIVRFTCDDCSVYLEGISFVAALDYQPDIEPIDLKKAVFYYLFIDPKGKQLTINESFIKNLNLSEENLQALLEKKVGLDLDDKFIKTLNPEPQINDELICEDAISKIFWHIFHKIDTTNEAYQFLLDHGFDRKRALETITANEYKIEPEWFKTVVNGLNPDLYIFTNASEDTVSSIFLRVYSSFTDTSKAKHFLSALWRNYHDYLKTTAVASLTKLIEVGRESGRDQLDRTEIKSVCSHLGYYGHKLWYDLFKEQCEIELTDDEQVFWGNFFINTPKATNLCDKQASEAHALLQYKLDKAKSIALNDFSTSNDLLFHFFRQPQPELEQSLRTDGHLLTRAEMKRPHLLFVIQYAILQMKSEYTQQKFDASLYQGKLFDDNSDTSQDFDRIRSLNTTKKWDLLIDTSIDQLSRSGYDQEILSEEQKSIVMNWAKHKLKEEFRSYAADNDFVRIFNEMCEDPSEKNIEKLQHAFYKHKTLSEKAIELIRMVLKWLGITPILGRACLFAEKHFLPTPVKINIEVDRLCSVVSNHSAPSA